MKLHRYSSKKAHVVGNYFSYHVLTGIQFLNSVFRTVFFSKNCSLKKKTKLYNIKKAVMQVAKLVATSY